MNAAASTAEGWYAGRDDASGWKGGPYTWEQLVTYAREGRVAPGDLVWHESLPDWIPAASVPGLFALAPAQPVAVAPVAQQPVAQQPVAQQPVVQQPVVAAPVAPSAPAPAPAPAKRRTGLVVGIIVAVLVLGLAGAGGWWAWSSGLIGGAGKSLGVAQAKLPDRAKLVKTKDFGEVPANQIGVTLKADAGRGDAERLATTLGGSIVGEVEIISLYQIEFPGTSEADLLKAIETAKADPKVEYAFANQQVTPDVDIKGVRIDPYDDPTYGAGAGDGYKAIGVSKAWAYIKGSGITLNDAHVGIVDSGLYAPGEGAESEFGGDVQVDFPDPAAGKINAPDVEDDGTTNPAGSHATGVATIIAADPNNGGPAGVAGPLGKKLKVSMINQYGGAYGDKVAAPDPNDPTKQVWKDGKTYSIGTLVALTKQIQSGSKVINCSWGNVNADPLDVATYKKFFETMAADHPDVVFVCSGGNTGTALDGSKRFPSGLKLPNMITVGAIDNDGKLAEYSSKSSANYEVTLAAPGTQAVVGIGSGDGTGPVRQDGTSFAAPHVTAAVAILQSINPKLTAGQIKEILVATARDGVTVGNPGEAGYQTNLAPPETGGKVLALDEAVLKVINDLRAAKKPPLDPLTPELLEKMGVIDAIASTGDPGEYAVRGMVEAAGEGGTDVKIDVSAENSSIGGDTTQKVSAPGEANWSVTLPKDEGVITVTRLDNGAGSRITIERLDINGNWSGTFTVTDVTITDKKAAEKEGCSAAILAAIKGKALPATMDITVDDAGQGSSVFQIDASSLSSDGKSSSKPVNFGVSYTGGSITFEPQGGGSGISGMTATVARAGTNLAMRGVMTAGGKGWKMTASVKLTKPATD